MQHLDVEGRTGGASAFARRGRLAQERGRHRRGGRAGLDGGAFGSVACGRLWRTPWAPRLAWPRNWGTGPSTACGIESEGRLALRMAASHRRKGSAMVCAGRAFWPTGRRARAAVLPGAGRGPADLRAAPLLPPSRDAGQLGEPGHVRGRRLGLGTRAAGPSRRFYRRPRCVYGRCSRGPCRMKLEHYRRPREAGWIRLLSGFRGGCRESASMGRSQRRGALASKWDVWDLRRASRKQKARPSDVFRLVDVHQCVAEVRLAFRPSPLQPFVVQVLR